MQHDPVPLTYRLGQFHAGDKLFTLCEDGVRYFFNLPDPDELKTVVLLASDTYVDGAVKCSAVSEDHCLARFDDEWAIDPSFGDWLAKRVPVWLWIEYEEKDGPPVSPDAA